MPRHESMTLSLRFSVQQEHARYYATCHFMGVVGQGDTVEQAVAAMKMEVGVVLAYCSQQGTMADLLAQRSARYQPPVSLLRDIRMVRPPETPTPEDPEWTTVEIDPAIIDSVMHGDLKAGQS